MATYRILRLIFLLIPFVAKSQQPKLVLPVGHNSIVDFAVFSPDGNKTITIGDNTIKIWDVRSGHLLADLTAHTSTIGKIAFSPDGLKIISASYDGSAKVWDATTGNLVFSLEHGQVVWTAFFSPDNNKIITSSSDSTLRIWDAYSGKLLLNLRDTGIIWQARFSPDSKKIIAGIEKTVKILDASSGILLHELKEHTHRISSAQFSPDGKSIITATVSNINDSTVKIWDALSGNLLLDLKGEDFENCPVSFSPDGRKIIVKDWQKNRNSSVIKVFDSGSGMLLHQLEHKSPLETAQFSFDGNKILAASYYDISLWDVNSGQLINNWGKQPAIIKSAQFSSDGEKVVSASFDGTAKIWDTKSGKLLANLTGHTQQLYSGLVSPKGTSVLIQEENDCKLWSIHTGICTGGLQTSTTKITAVTYSPNGENISAVSNGAFKTWDATTGKLVFELQDLNGKIEFATFSPDGSRIVTTIGATKEPIKIWNANSGKLVSVLELKEGIDKDVNRAAFSPDGKRIVAYAENSYDSIAGIWDVRTGKFLHPLDGHIYAIQSAEFSPDGKKIVTASSDFKAKVWDGFSGKLLLDLKHTEGVRSASFSPDGKKIITSCHEDTVRIWDANTGRLLLYIADISSSHLVSFSPDAKLIVTAGYGKKIKIWNSTTGKLLHTLEGHTDGIYSARFTPDGKSILTVSVDNTSKLWDVKTGKLIYTFFSLVTETSDYFGQIPSGYYQGTNNATKLLHYVTPDLKVITFEQLDVKYNRPDKVMEALGYRDTALIKSYRKAWEKRIRKLGIDTSTFKDGYSVPECDFADRDKIDYEQKQVALKLHIQGKDSSYNLDRFNVWVNESPVFGQRGINIRKKNNTSLDTTITILLSQGENRIETSITNVNGTESYRMPLYVNYTPAIKQKESLRFIGIGIDKFADPKNNLQYSTKDIRDLSLRLKEKYKDDIIIDTIFNEKLTVENIQAIKQKLQHTSVNDKVIISYSGHGVLSKDYDYYLSTYSMDFDNPANAGLPYEELENLLDSIPARKKLMLIDACHSGEVDKEEISRYEAARDSLSQQGTKGGGTIYTGKSQVGMKNSFDLMQSLFVNVGKSTGATIISAAAGTQFALERGDLKNGVFTYSILEAMEKNPNIKISELKKIVGERVEQLTNGLQKPTSRNELIASDWTL